MKTNENKVKRDQSVMTNITKDEGDRIREIMKQGERPFYTVSEFIRHLIKKEIDRHDRCGLGIS